MQKKKNMISVRTHSPSLIQSFFSQVDSKVSTRYVFMWTWRAHETIFRNLAHVQLNWTASARQILKRKRSHILPARNSKISGKFSILAEKSVIWHGEVLKV